MAGQLAVEEIWHQGDEPFCGQAVSHTLDLRVQAPPFLNHQNAVSRTLGQGQITTGGGSVRGEFDGF